jgi:hypothetical protein
MDIRSVWPKTVRDTQLARCDLERRSMARLTDNTQSLPMATEATKTAFA